MKVKVDAMIALVSFGALAGAHVALIPALVAFEMTGHSNVGFWVYVASIVPASMICTYVFIGIAAQMVDALGEKGQWVTVESSPGQPPKKVFIPPPFYKGGDRLPEVEQQMRDAR